MFLCRFRLSLCVCVSRLYAFNGKLNKMHIENTCEIKFTLIVHRKQVFIHLIEMSVKKSAENFIPCAHKEKRLCC